MVKAYPKGSKLLLGEHFTALEFDCQCEYPECKETLIDLELVQGLEQMRKFAGTILIKSGFRCMEHNADIGGVENSMHLLGKAADCKSPAGYNGNLMAQYAEKVEIFRKGGIGIYLRFVHVDIRKGPARWSSPLTC